MTIAPAGPRGAWLVDITLLAAAYVAGAQLRLFFPFTETGASWVWFPSGIALAALLLRGLDRWPGVAAGAVLASLLNHPHLASAIVPAIYAPAEALIAARLLRRDREPFDPTFGTVRAVVRYCAAIAAAAAAAAAVGAWNLVTLAPSGETDYALVYLTFWAGDTLAMLTVTPIVLVWVTKRPLLAGLRQRLEFGALVVVTFVIGAMVFMTPGWPVHVVLPVAYLSFPLMVWSAIRFGQPGVTAVIGIIGLYILVGTGRGLGPFAHAASRGEAVLVAGFMAAVELTALVLAALVQERWRAQSEQRSSEARFQAFMQHSPAIAFMKTADGRYVFGSAAWAAQFGRPAAELLGRSDAELWPPETAAAFAESDRTVLATGRPVELTEQGRDREGRPHWWTTLKFPIEQDDGSRLIGGIAIDVSPRMETEQALRASEERYRSLVELAGSVIVVIGDDGTITEFNREAEAFFGVSRKDVLGRPYLEACVPPAQREAIAADLERIRGGESLHGRESTWVVEDGSQKSFLWNATRLTGQTGAPQILVIGQDITELRRLEHQLLLAQRMEGIGRLAGGIAHDFNNLLTAILGHAEMAQGDVGSNESARGNIAEITRAASRAADLTRQLLAFARRQIIEPRIVDLNGLVVNVDRLLRRLLGEDIELVTVLDPELWRVKIDPGQFEQVLVNLVVNARDAMPTGGTLVIETRNVHLDEEFARQHATVQPGPHVLLAVSDTGTGMDEEVLAHIFEPFFTTKEVGKGTGLGLATCYGIVKQNKGSIWVHSEKGVGTTFRIYLPRAEGAAAPLDAGEARTVEQTPRGSETVLLVEDELLVRNLAADALRQHGYEVLAASTGLEALDLAMQTPKPVDVLVTDVVMPQMGGPQLAERLLAERPGLKVLFISGYSDMALTRQGRLLPGTALLQKPFTPGQLVRRVRELLDSTNAGPEQVRLPLA